MIVYIGFVLFQEDDSSFLPIIGFYSVWRVPDMSWLSLRSWRFHQQTRTIGISVSERIEDSPLGSRASKVITIDYFDDLGGWVSPQTAL